MAQRRNHQFGTTSLLRSTRLAVGLLSALYSVTFAATSAEGQLSLDTAVFGSLVRISGSIDVLDGCVLDWEVRRIDPESRMAVLPENDIRRGDVAIKGGKFAVELDLAAWGTSSAAVWVALQPRAFGTMQPAVVDDAIGLRGERLEGPGIISGFPNGAARRLLVRTVVHLAGAKSTAERPHANVPPPAAYFAGLRLPPPPEVRADEHRGIAATEISDLRSGLVIVVDPGMEAVARYFDGLGVELPNPGVAVGKPRDLRSAREFTTTSEVEQAFGCILAVGSEYVLATFRSTPTFLATLRTDDGSAFRAGLSGAAALLTGTRTGRETVPHPAVARDGRLRLRDLIAALPQMSVHAVAVSNRADRCSVAQQTVTDTFQRESGITESKQK